MGGLNGEWKVVVGEINDQGLLRHGITAGSQLLSVNNKVMHTRDQAMEAIKTSPWPIYIKFGPDYTGTPEGDNALARPRYIVVDKSVDYRNTPKMDDKVENAAKNGMFVKKGEILNPTKIERNWVRIPKTVNGLWLPILNTDGSTLLQLMKHGQRLVSPKKRRRLKSRAELLAERFARHCATVARR